MVYRAALPAGQRQPAWLGFIAVTDVDAAQKSAVGAGARSLLAPHDFPGRGRMAVLADPQGAVFGIVASTSGDPPEVLADSGDWIWSSLFTNDPDTAAAFYQTLFDYEVFADPEPERAQHLILASGGYSRAAANPLPSAMAHPHWLQFVRVDNTAATTQKAVSLGGKVLLAPRDDRHGGKIAIIADPQGAPVGLLEWPEDRDTKGLP
jgi:predicted enzyme related to lactoylglutathione lyase